MNELLLSVLVITAVSGLMYFFLKRELIISKLDLRKSEATANALLLALPDLSIRMKGDGTYLGIVSSDRLAVLNSDQSSSGYENIYDILPKEVADLRMHYIRQALQTRSMQIYEQQIEIEKTIQHEEVRIIVTGEDEVLNIIRDITDRKLAEEALRRSEEQLRSLIANIPGAIYRLQILDLKINSQNDSQIHSEWNINFISDAIADLSGYSPSELVDNQKIWDSLTYPEDRQSKAQILDRALTLKQPYQIECRLLHRDGGVRWVQEQGRGIFNATGEPLYIDGVMFDISDRKKAEEIAAINEQLRIENLRMGAELNVARQIQKMILPGTGELQIEGLDIAGYMEPADEVGGDYYDVLYSDDVTTICMGDVTGHGLESGLLTLMTQTAVRTLKEVKEDDPVRFLATLNRTIYKNLQRMSCTKNLSLVILNYCQGRLSISGQHEETLIVRANGNLERIDTMDLGFPIGLDPDITEFIHQILVDLLPGDGIVLYTDGITESIDLQKNQYGVERLCELVSQNWSESAEMVKQKVINDVRNHIGLQKVFDDISLLILKRQ